MGEGRICLVLTSSMGFQLIVNSKSPSAEAVGVRPGLRGCGPREGRGAIKEQLQPEVHGLRGASVPSSDVFW